MEEMDTRERLVRIETLLERLVHDLRNYRQAMDAFVPRIELDARFHAMEASLAAQGAMIAEVKANQNRAGWAIIGAWLAGLGTVGTILAKKL